MLGWPALESWTMEKLVARFANRRFLTDEVNSRGHKMKMTLVSLVAQLLPRFPFCALFC